MIRKYLSLLWSFFRASAIADLEYRLNLSVKILTDVVWYIAQLSVFEVLFRHTTAISGWTHESVRVFMGVLFIVDALWMLFFSENLDKMSDKVTRGDLDLLLAKPVSSQFMLSLQRITTPYLVNIVIATAWLIYSLAQLETNWALVLLLIILIPCSLGITYGIRFLFSATAVIFTKSENINYLWYQIYRLGTRPDTMYPPWLRYVILTVVPVGFLASVPARLILGRGELELIAGSVGLATLSLWISARFWRFALRYYASASS